MNNQDFQLTEDRESNRENRVWWFLAGACVTAITFFLRFYNLELKPLHHDEGVNGFFLTTLFRDGVYKYDPANYHGPDLYYFALAFSKIFGLNTLSIRASVAVFGVLTVVLTLCLKNYIGKIGSLCAALLLALSPGMVFISRYFIHEMLFVFFSLAIVVAVLYFLERRRASVAAIGWTALLLMICFAPSAVNLANAVSTDAAAVRIFQVVFFLVEAVLVFFILRMILAWDAGRPIYLILAAAAAVLLFATKETAFITVGTMLIACACAWLWRKIAFGETFERGKKWIFLAGTLVLSLAAAINYAALIKIYKAFAEFFTGGDEFQTATFYAVIFLVVFALIVWLRIVWSDRQTNEGGGEFSVENRLGWANFRAALGDRTNVALIIAAVSAVFIYVGVLFFSSFFTYPEGVKKAFEAYTIWTKTGSKDHTQNGTFAYLKWGMKIESPIFILSSLGILTALFKPKHKFALFAAFWAFGMFAAYTIIPYKTPWLALSFLLPMCIIAGYAVNELLTSRDVFQKIAGGILAISATGILAFQTYDLNFVRYDNDEMPYVYAHTRREFLGLINKIEYYADKSGKGKDSTIEIVSPDYWSMPWYLNDYPHANFQGQFVDANTAEMIVAKKDEQDAEAISRYSAHYKYGGTYPLRPGVELMLLIRRDLADADAKEIYTINGEPVTVR